MRSGRYRRENACVARPHQEQVEHQQVHEGTGEAAEAWHGLKLAGDAGYAPAENARHGVGEAPVSPCILSAGARRV